MRQFGKVEIAQAALIAALKMDEYLAADRRRSAKASAPSFRFENDAIN